MCIWKLILGKDDSGDRSSEDVVCCQNSSVLDDITAEVAGQNVLKNITCDSNNNNNNSNKITLIIFCSRVCIVRDATQIKFNLISASHNGLWTPQAKMSTTGISAFVIDKVWWKQKKTFNWKITCETSEDLCLLMFHKTQVQTNALIEKQL